LKFLHHIVLIALLTGSAFFLLPNLSFGQQEVIELLEGSDDIRLDGKSGNYIIKGNVVFEKEGTKLYCDSAYYNIVKEQVLAYSNVHLNKRDTLNMFCDSLFFDFNERYAKLWGNVRVRDNEYKLTTDSLDYDLKKDMGVYKNGGVITSITSSDKLTSKIGYFYPKNEQFNFRKNVVYSSDKYKITTDTLQFNGRNKKAYFFGPTNISGESGKMYCEKGWYNLNEDEGVLAQKAFIDRKDIYIEGDSLFYSSKDSLYVAERNVMIRDTANDVSFKGDYALNNEKIGVSFITGHAVAENYNNEDTLYIHADTLFSTLDSLKNPTFIQAYHEVTIYRGEMQGVCDSLVYNKEAGIIDMYFNPILWAKEAQLSGDTISVYEKKGEIDRAYLRKKSIVVSHVVKTDYYNQVTGTSMTAYFDSTEVKRVDIERNAKTIYFMEDEEESDTAIVIERKGMNRLYASDISLYFKEGDIHGATYRSEPDGILYPMNQIKKQEERTENFHWSPGLRPLSPAHMILNTEEKEALNIILQALFKLLL
jgi:lipopolysaccharide export system protein LptA